MGLKEDMLEMGFSENRAERACRAVHYESLERAVAWLESHENDADIDDPITETSGNVLGTGTDDTDNRNVPVNEPAYISLTEEQRAEKAAAVQEKLKERRAAVAEQERQEKVQKEKIRRKEGKSIAQIREEKAHADMKLLAQERKQQKIDDAKSRQQILDDIKADREKSKTDRNMERKGDQVAAPVSQAMASAPKVDYSECRLQLRLPSGSAIIHTFKAEETLGDVVAFLREQDSLEEFSLMTSFPRKVFQSSDYGFSLKSIGLCPSSVLIVSKK